MFFKSPTKEFRQVGIIKITFSVDSVLVTSLSCLAKPVKATSFSVNLYLLSLAIDSYSVGMEVINKSIFLLFNQVEISSRMTPC